jgi:hypothetical protein
VCREKTFKFLFSTAGKICKKRKRSGCQTFGGEKKNGIKNSIPKMKRIEKKN